MATFYAVRDRDRGDRYAVVALTDQVRPGFTRAYRWVPNFGLWVIDRGLLVDFHSAPIDQLNVFEEIDAATALQMTRELPKFTAKWVLDSYRDESERLTSVDLGLPIDLGQVRPSTDPHLAETLRKTPPGTWVTVRQFPAAKASAAQKWVSEVRLGKKKHLAALGTLQARQVRRDGLIEAQVRRPMTAATIVQTAQEIAEQAHAGQVDKAGQPYIGHPQRVADRLTKSGAPAEAIAAGWLHDVLEDTAITRSDLQAAGVPAETIAAVEAVTKRNGQTREDYLTHILATPLAVDVKRADLADNTDPQRMALLDEATRARLTKKYAWFLKRLSELDHPATAPR